MEKIPINTDEQGNAKTILAGYYKYGAATILGDTFGSTGTAVMEKRPMQDWYEEKVGELMGKDGNADKLDGEPKVASMPHGYYEGQIMDVVPSLQTKSSQYNNVLLEPQVLQKVGDRDNPSLSIKDVAFTIPANPMSDRGQVVLEPQVLNPLKDKTQNGWHFEQQVYDADGIARAVKAGGGSGNVPKVLEPQCKRVGNIYESNGQNGDIFAIDGLSPALRSGQGVHGNGIGSNNAPKIVEPQVLTPKRTEEGKRLRKDYESGKISKQRKEMTAMEPRQDGIANTLTTVQKDNLLAEPTLQIVANTAEGSVELELGGVMDISYPSSTTRRGRVQENGKVTPALTCGCESHLVRVEEQSEEVEYKGMKLKEGDGLYTGVSERFQRGGLEGLSRCLKSGLADAGCVQNYRIRKLTERECFRLMGVNDEDSDKIREVVSRSQCYKLAGNSIVVDCMTMMFDQLFYGNKNEYQQLELF